MSYSAWKRYAAIAMLFLISACIGHPQIRGSNHKGHFHQKNRNAMMIHYQEYDHITLQGRPHMHDERKSRSLVRSGNYYRHQHHIKGRNRGMMTPPSSASTRTHIKESMFRKAHSFQTSNVTPSSTRHKFQNRIIGGIPAEAEEFKFFASLDIGCGGSLIAPNFILTAAHCAGSINTVRIGSNEVGSGGSLNSVVTECIHPNYEPLTTTNDFMLLKLQSPVDTNTYPTIQLNNDKSVPLVDHLLTVIGFGATSEGGSGSSTLLKVEVPVNSHQECNQQYGGSIVEEVMFCAGFPSGGKDSCQGDSGGPIFEVLGGQPVQVGVVSFGEGCARPNKSGVYSRVSGAYDWIQTTMEKLNQGDTSGCNGGSTGGPDDDSFPTQVPVQGPTGTEPTSGSQPTIPIAVPVSVPISTNGPVSVAPIFAPTMEVPIEASPSAPNQPILTNAPFNGSPVAAPSPFAFAPTSNDSPEYGDDHESPTDDDGGFWNWWS